MTEAALRLHGISKRFGPVIALDDVSFSARRGSVHALLGENGAGKTTLMRIAFGLIRPDAGWVEVDGRRITLESPADAIAAGIGMVHQQFSLVPAMSVAENVALGGKGRFRREEIAKRIADIGRRTGLMLDPSAAVAGLGSAERQKLEIIRTLAHDAQVLILDEPTAVLTPRDIGELFAQLRAFATSGGSVVLITHKLHDALAHADEVTVLRRGRVALNASMSDVTLEALTSAMLGDGEETGQRKPVARIAQERPLATLSNVVVPLGRRALSNPLSLDVFGGEVLGVAALEGSASVVLRLLAGRITPISGSADIPAQVGFVPENRLEEAIVTDFTLAENFALKGSGSRRGLLSWNEMGQNADSVIREFDVVAPGSRSTADTLSGGNQQRFVLGRELKSQPLLLVLENPTQGLDVKAAAAIHSRVRETAARGTAVVFYSSDLDELAGISDRVLVVRSSGLEFCPPERDAIGRLLLEAERRPTHV